MTEKTHTGGCHCGKVRYEAKLDTASGTGKCNCSMCAKARLWGFRVKPEDFKLIQGESELTDYQFNTNSCHHLFCKHCGVRSFEWSDIPQAGGKFFSVMVNCIDDIDLDEVFATPIRYANGKDNNWWEPPAETRHL